MATACLYLDRALNACALCLAMMVFSSLSSPPPCPQFSTIRRTVSRVVFLHDGVLRWDGPVAELDTTDNPYVRQYFDASLSGPMQFPDDGELVPVGGEGGEGVGAPEGGGAEEGGNGTVVALRNGAPPQ